LGLGYWVYTWRRGDCVGAQERDALIREGQSVCDANDTSDEIVEINIKARHWDAGVRRYIEVHERQKLSAYEQLGQRLPVFQTGAGGAAWVGHYDPKEHVKLFIQERLRLIEQ
jgi:DNA-binding IclR family transcriptional regulator